jgi:hypothetical protein
MSERSESPRPGTKVYTTKTAKIWICKEEIFHISCLPGSVHGLEEALENMEVFPTEGKVELPVLADIRHVKAIEREAREVYRSRDKYNMQVSALAILVGSPLSRAIGNFFIGLSRMPMPTRLFTSEADAVQWLKEARGK